MLVIIIILLNIHYTKELHDKEKATADHTTLLLNCYTKLKNVEELNNFVKVCTHVHVYVLLHIYTLYI